MIKDAESKTPTPGNHWVTIEKNVRIIEIERALSLMNPPPEVKVTRVRDNGDVFVELEQTLSPGERGTMLRELEFWIKENVDEALVVWCEPIGDRNSLRKLRGIEISKSEEERTIYQRGKS